MLENHGEIAALLITEYNAPLDIVNKESKTPLDLASEPLKAALEREGVL